MNEVKYKGILPPHIIKIAKDEEIHLKEIEGDASPFLFMEDGQLGLLTSEMIAKRERPLSIDIEKMLKYHQKQKYSLNDELFAKVLGRNELRNLSVFDLTCGLACDFSLMLSFGVKKIMAFERESIIFLMLYDAWDRLGLRGEDKEKYKLHYGDYLFKGRWDDNMQGDILYFDPMFETQKKKKSLPKKEMRIFQSLIFNPINNNIFTKFQNSNFKKLIIKRPLGGSYYHSERPAHSHLGKSIRYDIYLKPV